ncbi:MAG: ankyrin repeat domain-containing protein [Rhodothermales bacterium]
MVEAVRAENLQALTHVLDKGADPNARVDVGYRYPSRTLGHEAPVLALAAYLGNWEIVQVLAEKGANVNGVCIEGLVYPFSDDPYFFESGSVLCVAAEAGHYVIVDILIAMGASIDGNIRAPLIGAARKGHSMIVERLLREGADPNREDGDYRTPLYYATAAGFAEIVRNLLDYGAQS